MDLAKKRERVCDETEANVQHRAGRIINTILRAGFALGMMSLHAWAQGGAETDVFVADKRVDTQIARLLDKVEALVGEGHITSPAGDNASESFAQVLMLVPAASLAGLQRVEGFASVLKEHASSEQAAGNKETSLWFSAFSEVSAVDTATFVRLQREAATTRTSVSVEQETAGGAAKNSMVTHDSPLPQANQEPTERVGSAAPNGASQRTGSHTDSGPVTAALQSRGSDSERASVQVNPRARGADEERTSSPLMIEALLSRGAAVLADGDISAARLLFARAAESGSGKAALAMADTYNPKLLVEQGVQGLRADPESAKAWYRKAVALSEPKAIQRLNELGEGTETEAVGLMTSR